MSDKISKYFTREEIACKCGCGFEVMHPETLAIADAVRELVMAPVVCNSGCRCGPYNRSVGSSDVSQHTKGRAMDLQVSNSVFVYRWLCDHYHGRCGFGLYENFVHVDSRPGDAARW